MNDINEINLYIEKYNKNPHKKILLYIEYLVNDFKKKINNMINNSSNLNDTIINKINNKIHSNNIQIKEYQHLHNIKKKLLDNTGQSFDSEIKLKNIEIETINKNFKKKKEPKLIIKPENKQILNKKQKNIKKINISKNNKILSSNNKIINKFDRKIKHNRIELTKNVLDLKNKIEQNDNIYEKFKIEDILKDIKTNYNKIIENIINERNNLLNENLKVRNTIINLNKQLSIEKKEIIYKDKEEEDIDIDTFNNDLNNKIFQILSEIKDLKKQKRIFLTNKENSISIKQYISRYSEYILKLQSENNNLKSKINYKHINTSELKNKLKMIDTIVNNINKK